MNGRGLLVSLRAAGCALAWLAAFALVSSTLAAWAPFPDVPQVAEKLAHLARHRRDFDALFIGSSRVHSQVVPALFDPIAATHSFNAGVQGMVPPESFYFVRRVLALRLPRLKWLLIELADLQAVVDPRNARTTRGIYWHDAHHTRMVCRDLWESSRPLGRKLEMLVEHLGAFVQRAANVGRGAPLVAQRFLPEKPPKETGTPLTQTGGFIPVAVAPLPDAYLERVRAAQAEKHRRAWPAMPLRPVYLEALRELIAELRRAGIEPVFFTAPTFDRRDRFAAPDDLRVLTFHDEARYPALFDPQHYADPVHLNERGAVLYTTALAEQFAALR